MSQEPLHVPGLGGVVPDVATEPATEATAPGVNETPAAVPPGKTRGMFARGLEVFLENKLAIAGLAILGVIVCFCFLGPLLYHTDQIHTDLANENLGPGAG